jgi:hypothetical protein
MITTNKVGWSIPGSKSMFVLQMIAVLLSKQRYTNYPRDLPMHTDITSATMQTKLAERSSNWGLNSSWVSLGGPELRRP